MIATYRDTGIPTICKGLCLVLGMSVSVNASRLSAVTGELTITRLGNSTKYTLRNQILFNPRTKFVGSYRCIEISHASRFGKILLFF